MNNNKKAKIISATTPYGTHTANGFTSCVGVKCIICGETVPLTEEELSMSYVVKICDKCKKAIMKVREE